MKEPVENDDKKVFTKVKIDETNDEGFNFDLLTKILEIF